MLISRASVILCSLTLCSAGFGTAPAQVGGSAGGASAAKQQASYASDPQFSHAMAEGQRLEKIRDYVFAADEFKKANKIAKGACFDCLAAQYKVDMKDGDFKDASGAASAMEGLASSPGAKSLAEYQHARALYAAAGDKPKQEKLEAVHGLLQEAIASSPEAAPLFLDGKVLAQMGKLEEAKQAFFRCVQCVSPTDPGRLRAQHFAEDPELALHKMAPAFAVTALDGSKFNLDAMGGRVVLIDFWATWCGPCNRELPHMKEIAKRFANEPLVIISVSWDTDEAKWRDFIQKNEMTWVQYRDADKALTRAFGVDAIPHYFTIDADGVLTSEMLGTGSDVEGKLKKLIAKAQEAQKRAAAPPSPSAQAPGD